VGFRGAVDKFQEGGRGYRNTFDLGMFDPFGRKYQPYDFCAQPSPVESILIAQWGPFVGIQRGDGFTGWHPVEIQSSNAWIAHESTNSAPDAEWDDRGTPSDFSDDLYKLTGKRRFCFTLRHLDHYVCQDGEMTNRGRLVGFSTSIRVPK
jgi:hypothetical protein